MSDPADWPQWMKDVAVSVGHDETAFDDAPVCLICQEPIPGSPTVVVIKEPHGLSGVRSDVSLCEEHSNVHPRIIRKRLEDYYS